VNRRDLKNIVNQSIITVVAMVGILALIGLFIFIIRDAIPALTKVGAEIFTSKYWYPTYDPPEYGMLAMITGSFILTGFASIIVIPIGYIIAFFLYDYATNTEQRIIKSAIDLLSGIPTVIIGSFLFIYVSPILMNLGAWSTGNLLLAAIGLSILSLPYAASLMQEALSAVDISLKESALALGASRFTAGFRIVSKAALSGILNSIILTINRIIGETIVVLMVAGGAAIIPKSIWDPVRPLTAAIASEMGEVPIGSIHYSALFVAGLILLTISFILTMISRRVTRSWKR
jgi:phosphate transport system permease protein